MRKYIVVFPGRFQPPHIGHKGVYDYLVKTFGDNKVYIATSDKVDKKKSFLNFEQKKMLLLDIIGINKNNILKVINPYKVTDYEDLIDFENDSIIFAIGEKDNERLNPDSINKNGKESYFKTYDKNLDYPAKQHAYVTVIPNQIIDGEVMNATLIRGAFFDNDLNLEQKFDVYNKLTGSNNKELFNDIIVKTFKLNENKKLKFSRLIDNIIYKEAKCLK